MGGFGGELLIAAIASGVNGLDALGYDIAALVGGALDPNGRRDMVSNVEATNADCATDDVDVGGWGPGRFVGAIDLLGLTSYS